MLDHHLINYKLLLLGLVSIRLPVLVLKELRLLVSHRYATGACRCEILVTVTVASDHAIT